MGSSSNSQLTKVSKVGYVLCWPEEGSQGQGPEVTLAQPGLMLAFLGYNIRSEATVLTLRAQPQLRGRAVVLVGSSGGEL